MYVTAWQADAIKKRVDGDASSVLQLGSSAGRPRQATRSAPIGGSARTAAVSFSVCVGSGVGASEPLSALDAAFEAVRVHTTRPALPLWLVSC
eukprot:scaffold329047_cov73-Tisochrysis_lutea.AAC.1